MTDDRGTSPPSDPTPSPLRGEGWGDLASDASVPTPSPSHLTPSPLAGEGGGEGARRAAAPVASDVPTGTEADAIARALDPIELAEIKRLDEALNRLDAGDPTRIDPREDPELAALISTALAVDDSYRAAADQRAFHSFHHRSRAAILHELEADLPVPFRDRVRLFVGAAAGIAAVAIAVTALGAPLLDGARDPEGASTDGGARISATNLTPRSTQDQFAIAATGVRERTRSGQAVPSAEYHKLNESTARAADAITREPESVTPDSVRALQSEAQQAREDLEVAEPAPGAEGAAVAARRGLDDLLVAASGYLRGATSGSDTEVPEATADDPTAEATSTATPDPTSTGTPEPTATATSSSTPTSTATPTPTSTAAPTVDTSSDSVDATESPTPAS